MNTERNEDKESMFQNMSYSRIAEALSKDYFSIYYVDMETDRFVEYSSDSQYQELKVEQSGEDFFGTSRRNIVRVVFPEDQEKAMAVFDKAYLEQELRKDGTFTTSYRLMFDDVPVYISIKAILLDDEKGRFLVIGISNIDAQMKRQAAYEAAQEESLTYSRIAQALSQDYYSIYYVDIETDDFTEYSSQEQGQELKLVRNGVDFFNDCKQSIPQVVHPEDQEIALAAFEKDRLLKELEDNHTFTISYRFGNEENSVYVSLKALRLGGSDSRHIVIGISNIDAQMKRQQALEEAKQENMTFASIAQALAADYFSIYYVNTETDHFIEYSSHDEYQELGIEKGGEDFFNLSRKNILRVIYPEDQNILLSAFTKENIMNELAKNHTFTLNYRLMFGEEPTYVSMKATRMADKNDPHIVIGVNNIDIQMKRQQEYERAREESLTYSRIAYRDPLTGVKSKHAYSEAEKELDEEITAGNADPFAVVVCDVNGLKAVNDTLGHKAGDEFIRNACRIICEIYKHSPVYRIGGDEFAVIMHGQDYEQREVLFAELDHVVRHNSGTGGIVIAGGMSDFDAAQDKNVAAVFERADAEMYEHKRELKQI